jgi:hypothetical protein
MSTITPETIAALKAAKSAKELASVAKEKAVSPQDIYAYLKENATTPEELVALAKGLGHAVTLEQAERFLNPKQGELADEELANVVGGECCFDGTRRCRYCNGVADHDGTQWVCRKCEQTFK